MPPKVNLYDNAYEKYNSDVYRNVRIDTYGEDFGQTSWLTTQESNEIPRLLHLAPESRVLEIGCGSGRYALRVAEKVNCFIVGLDINAHGIDSGNEEARTRGLDSKVRFEQCDVSRSLPFDDESFDAAFANDVMCHIPGRSEVFAQILRVLKPGARLFFSDALVIGGVVSHEEIATRSSIGYYLFSPPGENERLLQAAGFEILAVDDTSANAAAIAQRWRDSRDKWRTDLIAAEGQANFDGLQRFLGCVHTLCAEGRLRRYTYLARRSS